MQSGDLVAVVRMNDYRFEDVFLSQALRIQNFISLRSLVRHVFRRWRQPPGDSLPRDLLRHKGRSMLITGNMSRLAEKYGFKPTCCTERHHDIIWNSLIHGDLDWRLCADDRAELRRCVFGALLQYQTVDKALERLLQVDHLPSYQAEATDLLEGKNDDRVNPGRPR